MVSNKQKLIKRTVAATTSAFMVTTMLPISSVVAQTNVVDQITATAEEKLNLALNKATTASYSYNTTNFAPSKVVDGDLATRWSTEPKGSNQWLQVDLGSETEFNEFGIYSETNDKQKIKKYKIEGSHDGSTFEMIFDAPENVAGYGFDQSVTLDNGATYRYVRITVESLIDGAYPSVSLREFEIYNTVTNTVDKTELQKIYNECKDFTPTYLPTTSGYYTKYTTAVTRALNALNNPSVDENEVYLATKGLENRYWLAMLQDYVYHYSPTRGNFDYQLYKTDSILPLYTAYLKSADYSTNADTPKDTEEFKVWYQKFVEAEENIELYNNETNIAYGLNGTESGFHFKDVQGEFVISESIVKDEKGKNSLQLNIEFKNNGINQITKEQNEKLSSNELGKASFRLDYKTVNGRKGSFPIKSEDITVNGSESVTITVNVDKYLENTYTSPDEDFEGSYYVEMTSGTSIKLYSIGNFKSSNYTTEEVNKDALQALYDETKDYLPTYLPHDWHISDFNTALNNASTVLANVDATQEEVNGAYILLNARYWSVKAQDYQYKYEPSKKNFDFHPYTTESLLPLMKHQMLTYDLWFSGKTDEYAAQYKEACEKFVQLENELVLVGDQKGLFIGFDEDSVRTGNKQGHFTVTQEMVIVDGEEKAKLHIEFINDGIHPVSGKDKGMFTIEDMSNGRFTYTQYDYSGKIVRSDGLAPNKLSPLDGETDKTKGIQVDLIVEPGEYFFDFGTDYNKVYGPGFFRTDNDTTAPTAVIGSSYDEATNTVLITMTTSESVKDIEGWTRVNDTVFTKVYTTNGDYSVEIEDLVGNKAIVDFTVDDIVVVNGVTLGDINKQLVYVKQGETLKLAPKDTVTGEPVEVTYELNTKNGYITVTEDGLVEAIKEATKTHTITQVNVKSVVDPTKSTFVHVVVPKQASLEEVKLVGCNGFENGGFENFIDGGYVSGNANSKYSFNVGTYVLEWHNFKSRDNQGLDIEGLPTAVWTLDGKANDPIRFGWKNGQRHSDGTKAPKFFDTGKLAYGEHTVSVVVRGYDGSTDEKSLTFVSTPIWRKGSSVTGFTPKTAGKVVIPDVLDGVTITDLVADTSQWGATNGIEAGVTEVVIPATVTTIHADFFANATDLEKVTFLGEMPEIVGDGIFNNTKIGAPGSVVVKEGTEMDYVNADVEWITTENHATFTTIARAIGLDLEAPTATVSYSESVDGVVTVTLTASEELQDIAGWTTTNHITFTKEYTVDTTETVAFTDLAGNTGSVEVSVDVVEVNTVTFVDPDGNVVSTIKLEIGENLTLEDIPSYKVTSPNVFRGWLGPNNTYGLNGNEFLNAYPTIEEDMTFKADVIAAITGKHKRLEYNAGVYTIPPTNLPNNSDFYYYLPGESFVLPKGPQLGENETTFKGATFMYWESVGVNVGTGLPGNKISYTSIKNAISYITPVFGQYFTVEVDGEEVSKELYPVNYKSYVLSEWLPENPEKEGYRFIGWEIDGTVYTKEELASSKLKFTQPKTAVARFVEAIAPTAKVTYDVTTPTNGNVVVTLTTNEPVEAIEGWNKVSDTVFTKEYTENVTETITFKDLAGNVGQATVSITNIDKIAPTATVTYEVVNGKVVAKITTSEAVKDIEGWNKVSDSVFTKEYATDTTETVIFTDLVGNTGNVEIVVKETDQTAPKAFFVINGKLTEVNSEGVYGKVDLKFNDNKALDYYVLNGHKAPTGISGTWADGNYQNIKNYLQHGENTLTVYDKAGNSTTYTFTLDFVAPIWNYGGINYTVTVPVGTELTLEDFLEATKAAMNVSDDYTSQENIVIQPDSWQWNNYLDTNKVGTYRIDLYAFDEVGNKSYNLGITVIVKESDETAPKAYFSQNGELEEIVNDVVTNDNISLKFHDDKALDYYVLNGHKSPTGISGTWADGNYQNIKGYLLEGKNELVVFDKAGNSTEYVFYIDHVTPNIKVNGTQENGAFTEVTSIALHDAIGLKSVEFNGKVTELTEKYYYISSSQLTKYGELVLGENVIVLTDKAGNEKTYTFIYSANVDKQALLDKFNNEVIIINCEHHMGHAYSVLPNTVLLKATEKENEFTVSIDLEEYIVAYSRDTKVNKDHFVYESDSKFIFTAIWDDETKTWSYSAGDWNVWAKCL